MRRVLKWASVVLGVIVALPVVAVIAVLIALNTGPGQRLVERETTGLTGGMVVLTGLSGSFPSALRAARVEIHDAAGPWLVLQDIALDWSPLALLHRDAHVDRLAVGIVSVARLPESSPQPQKPAATSNSGFTLPVTVDIDALSVGRFDLAAPIAGTPATLAIDGQAHLASLEQGTATLAIRQLDGPGRYTISGAVDPAHLTAHIALDEPTRGLLSRLGQVPELGALSAKADLDGPRAGAGLSLAVAAGPLRATAKGTIDLVHDAADLDVTASAPHMQPRAGVSWDAIALDAHVHGPFTRPDAAGSLEVTQLAAAGAAIAKLTAKVSGNAGQSRSTPMSRASAFPGRTPNCWKLRR